MTRNILSGLLLLLFCSYYAGITLFPHVHTFGENKLVHSHPYKGACGQSAGHSHSQAEIQFIAKVSLFLTLAAVGMVFVFSCLFFRQDIVLFETCNRQGSDIRIAYSQRGPPSPLFC